MLSDGSVIANIKYVSKFTDFSSVESEQNGNYFPFSLGSEYSGKTIKVQRVAPTVGTETVSEDLDWVLKVKKGSRFTVKADDKLVLTLNFRQSTLDHPPIGKDAFKADKTDFGGFGNNAAYYKDGKVDILWDGTTAKVSGELNWLDGEARKKYTKLTADGNYLAFALGDWFKGKGIMVDNGGKVASAADTDWVCHVEEEKKSIIVKFDGAVIATFDLSGVTLGKAAPGEP